MLYAILCYTPEAVIGTWPKEKEDAVFARRQLVKDRLQAQGRLGPVLRLMPTTAATTVRAGGEPVVIDGPFGETKEQLLGLYVVECSTLEEAIETARALAHESGALEVRPIRAFNAGGLK